MAAPSLWGLVLILEPRTVESVTWLPSVGHVRHLRNELDAKQEACLKLYFPICLEDCRQAAV